MYKKKKLSVFADYADIIPNTLSMKLSVILMFSGIMQVSAYTYGQKVTIHKKNVKLTNVLKEIQKQSGYNILYDSALVPSNLTLDVNLHNEGVDKTLSTILRTYELEYKIVDKNIILSRKSRRAVLEKAVIGEQQKRVVTGKIVNEKSEILSNVSVSELGADNGTMTDDFGNFTLTLKGTAPTLVFTFVGYQKQEIILGNESTLQVTMQPMLSDLDEVVVVGYGEQKKVNLTGAVSQIAGEEFEDRPVSQLTQALQGAIPNLNVVFGSGKPGTSGAVNVRGNTSINGGGPLILIDGILGTLDRINVNDVESVTVLKDASAA